MNKRPSILGVLLVLVLMLPACASNPPVRELRVNSSAFGAARSAGEAVLDETVIAITEQEQAERHLRGDVPPLYPAAFDPAEVHLDPEAALPAVLQVRRLAFRTIADYNEALLALAEGRTMDELQARVGNLAATTERLLPLLGMAGGPLPGLVISGLQSAIAAAEQARERELLERAILEGYDDVDGIITALIADSPELYALQRARWEAELNEADREMGDLRRSMVALVRGHRATSDPAEVQALVELEQRVDRAFASTAAPAEADRLPGLTLAPASEGGAVFDATLLADLRSHFELIEAAAERYAGGVQAINVAYEAIREYVLLLRRARQSLDALRSATTAPPTANEVLVRVVETGVQLRAQADQVQEISRVLRAR